MRTAGQGPLLKERHLFSGRSSVNEGLVEESFEANESATLHNGENCKVLVYLIKIGNIWDLPLPKTENNCIFKGILADTS